MNSNYEWQKQQTQQRIQKRMQESHQHRKSKQQNARPDEGSSQSIIRLPLRLITAIFSLGR